MRKDLQNIFDNALFDGRFHLSWQKGLFIATRNPTSAAENRIALGRFYEAWEGDRGVLRELFRQEAQAKKIPWNLPTIIGEDGFLRLYAEGKPLPIPLLRRIHSRAHEPIQTDLPPIVVGHTEHWEVFYNVKATPRGLMPKLSSTYRMKQDKKLLDQVQSDLSHIIDIKEMKTRQWLTLAVLSHGAAYRELDGTILNIPSLSSRFPSEMIPYAFRHHLIWEGIKTISATPLEHEFESPGLYLCQGTEIWPSQPSVLGTLFANLGKEGAATEPYAYAWRQIHRHLRFLHKEGGPLPIVAGHSMGGALATQIALYSHPLIDKAYAFNPPVVEERDYQLYSRLDSHAQKKLQIFANLDDLPFWRIGAKVIGCVHVLLASQRWSYRPIRLWEAVLILPLVVKILVNLFASFPSHQNIFAFNPQYLIVPLTAKEIRRENAERKKRFDHLDFIWRFHFPAQRLLQFVRKNFRWSKQSEYVRSQIELLELHEQDLLDTISMTNGASVKEELAEVRRQKEALQKRAEKKVF